MLDRFLRHAAAVRARKAFDAEERNLRVRPLARLRRLIARSRDGEGWREDFDRLFHARMNGLAGLPMPLLLPRHAAWASDWAEGDAASLRAALAEAASSDANAEERFAAFASAAARAGRGGDEGSLIAVGSLLNFAREPRSLPVVRARPLNRLETMLEQPAQPGLDAPELYAHHLRFVRGLADRMREAGIDVRDLIDAEALIEVSLAEADLWAPGSEDAERRRLEAAGRRAPAYLSLCAVYRDEAPYLAEWIEFHRLVGVDRFFLYDNLSSDDHREVLAPHLADGTVEIVPWTVPSRGQTPAYNDCLAHHRDDSRWIAFLDVDEFLFSPTGRPLPEVLADYEQWPGVVVNSMLFGPSGHESPPSGLVTESYTRTGVALHSYWVKNIVDPARVTSCRSAHRFLFNEGLAVNEDHVPVATPLTKSFSHERLRINHYYTRSLQEARPKWERTGSGSGVPRPVPLDQLVEALDEREDGTILTYLPALKSAVESRAREVSS